jgi:hypothetical protein
VTDARKHAPPIPAESRGGPAGNARRSGHWLPLAVIGLAQLMIVLGATIVSIAPLVHADLGRSAMTRAARRSSSVAPPQMP